MICNLDFLSVIDWFSDPMNHLDSCLFFSEGGESRPRDPRLHSSKQLQKQSQEIFGQIKPLLEKAKKVRALLH